MVEFFSAFADSLTYQLHIMETLQQLLFSEALPWM